MDSVKTIIKCLCRYLRERQYLDLVYVFHLNIGDYRILHRYVETFISALWNMECVCVRMLTPLKISAALSGHVCLFVYPLSILLVTLVG